MDHLEPFIERLCDSGKQIYLATAGTTSGLVSKLWQTPGASAYLLGSRFCNAQEELMDFLGFTPTKYVTEETAKAMAAKSYWHGMELAVRRGIAKPDVIGVGMSAAVATKRHRRGNDHVFIAIRTKETFKILSARFWSAAPATSQDERKQLRATQAACCDEMALIGVLHAAIAGDVPSIISTQNMHTLSITNAVGLRGRDGGFFAEYQDLWGKEESNWTGGDEIEYGKAENFPRAGKRRALTADDKVVLLPGSFDPLHHGHIGLAQMIERMTGRKVVFEISSVHPNKGKIPEADLCKRRDQFDAFAPVVISENAPLYIDKAREYPGIPIAIGADAALELLDQRHYGSRAALFNTLEELLHMGAVFYVVGREVCGSFVTRDDIPLPPRFYSLFHDVSFREDVSSTQLREAAKS